MDFLTVLPPILAILIAVLTRNVYVALILGIGLSETILAAFNPGMGLLNTIDRLVSVFEDSGNTQILVFCLLIGILICYMRDSGGVAAMAKALINKGVAKSSRRAESVVAATGTAIFVETNVSLLSSGVLGRPLYDAHNLSRERLAYIIDSTSAPISVILMLNAWGAYADRLIQPYGFENTTAVIISSIPWNFYALVTLVLVFLTIYSGKVFGPMRHAETRQNNVIKEQENTATKAIYMWLPLLVMIIGALAFMAWTGEGDITKGSGAQSILWSITVAVLCAALLLKVDKVFTSAELQKKAFSGINEMIPMVTVLLFAIAFGASLRSLGTGEYVSAVATSVLPAFAVPAILFVTAGLTSFFTGTSWGTYGILVPIAIPIAIALDIPPSLALAAVLGGGVFGDHCSPISDTTLIASVAAGTDHLSHVKTQLPYALLAALISVVFYIIAGLAAA